MKIVADENIPLVSSFFSHIGEITLKKGRELTKADLSEADILLVRSVTPVNEALLSGTPVKFVGTATIGTDHIDLAYLTAQNIGFANAPGSNANSVVEYVLCAINKVLKDELFDLSNKQVGIIADGNVGGRVRKRFDALGAKCYSYDPYKEDTSDYFASLEDVLKSDIVCMHAPYTDDGDFPTHHLVNAENLSRLPENALLLNAGRGGVINNDDLSQFMQERPDVRVVLDVWENEPRINTTLLQQVDLATPHIAGYSLDGKMKGVEMLYLAVCKYFAFNILNYLPDLLPEPEVMSVRFSSEATLEFVLPRLLNLAYDIEADHYALVKHKRLTSEELGTYFDAHRKHYPVRREFSNLHVKGVNQAVADQLEKFGFNVQR